MKAHLIATPYSVRQFLKFIYAKTVVRENLEFQGFSEQKHRVYNH